MSGRLARWVQPANLLLMPLLIRQGKRVRASMPLLPAAQRATGAVPGSADDQPLHLLVFGDSLAAGVGVDDNNDAIAGQVAERLARSGRPLQWRVVAAIGATSGSLLRKHVARIADGDRPDITIVLFGMNDLLRYRDLRTWRRNARELLAGVRAQVGQDTTIVVGGIPPIDQFRALPQPMRAVFGLRARAMDGLLTDIARKLDIRHVRINDHKITADADFFAVDNFHPSANGYRQLADRLAEAAASHHGVVPVST